MKKSSYSVRSIFVLGKKVEKVTPLLNYLPSLKKQNQDYAKKWPIFQSALHEYLHNETNSGKKLPSFMEQGLEPFVLSTLQISQVLSTLF